MLSRLELRIQNRRSFRRYLLFCALDANGISQCMLICMFILLALCMIGNPPVQGLAVDQYRSQRAVPMPQALRDDAMNLVITRDGTLYFDKTKVEVADLPDLIRQRLATGCPRKVFFAVDFRAKYGDVSVALDGVRSAGIRDIAFLSEVPVPHR